jgi:hypothetical protein
MIFETEGGGKLFQWKLIKNQRNVFLKNSCESVLEI